MVLGCMFAGSGYNQTQASGVTPEDIASIERELFNQTYSNESINSRLDKIEKMIYGQNFHQNDINERINNLTPFIPANSVNNNIKIPIIKDTTSSSKRLPVLNKADSEIKTTKPDYLKGSLPPRQSVIFTEEPKNTTDYPSIDQAEKTLLGKVFTSDDVYTRLERLETKLSNLDETNNLHDRMNNIGKQIKYLSLKEKYHTARNVKKGKPDINIMPETINNPLYNKNFSNGIQDQYINSINSSNSFLNFQPARVRSSNKLKNIDKNTNNMQSNNHADKVKQLFI